MKILLTGPTGQVGWELARSLLPLGKVFSAGREIADFSEPDSLRSLVRGVEPDVIINAAAYTKVDKAEDEEDIARIINSQAPGVLAEEAGQCNALLIHYSTDYVFDGKNDQPYLENTPPCPLNVYGRTKLEGEKTIQASGCDYLIFRTSWVYASRGENFIRTMCRLFMEKEELNIVNDQIGAPTWARFIADSTAQVLREIKFRDTNTDFESGIFNLTSTGKTSWYEFAKEIEKILRLNNIELKVHKIHPVNSDSYPQKAVRPNYSCLSLDKLRSRFYLYVPPWQKSVHLCINDILGQESNNI